MTEENVVYNQEYMLGGAEDTEYPEEELNCPTCGVESPFTPCEACYLGGFGK